MQSKSSFFLFLFSSLGCLSFYHHAVCIDWSAEHLEKSKVTIKMAERSCALFALWSKAAQMQIRHCIVLLFKKTYTLQGYHFVCRILKTALKALRIGDVFRNANLNETSIYCRKSNRYCQKPKNSQLIALGEISYSKMNLISLEWYESKTFEKYELLHSFELSMAQFVADAADFVPCWKREVINNITMLLTADICKSILICEFFAYCCIYPKKICFLLRLPLCKQRYLRFSVF